MFVQQGRHELAALTLTKMQWDIVINLAGPMAEAAILDDRTKSNMLWTALLYCGAKADLERAETVLAHYRAATKRQYGLTRFGHRTRELVLSAWPAIEALAHALLKFEVIKYDQAAAIALPLLAVSPAVAP
jgi:threonine/homoserine efflux transporter RhtA